MHAQFLQELYNKYGPTFGADHKLYQKEFDAAFQLIEDRVPQYFDWQTITTTQEINEELKTLLHNCLKVNTETNELKFDNLNAKFACHQLIQTLKDVTTLQIASAPYHQGIQEKFLKSKPSIGQES